MSGLFSAQTNPNKLPGLLIKSELAKIASEVPVRLGCCHGPTEARGQYVHWARKHLHRESLRELMRCRHAALDRILLRPTETYAGDPEHCRMMDDSPDDPGVFYVWDSSDAQFGFSLFDFRSYFLLDSWIKD